MCDKQCVGWKCRDICAHSLAAAEDNKLHKFLIWFRTTKTRGNKVSLTKAVYHDTYKHAGQKKPSRRKYGDTVHLPLNQKTDRIPLTDISNVDGTKLSVIQNDHCYAKTTVETAACGVGEANKVILLFSIQQYLDPLVHLVMVVLLLLNPTSTAAGATKI